MATLVQTTDEFAPETWALVKHELGFLDIRTGEIVESLDGHTQNFVIMEAPIEVWRGEEFEGTYYEFIDGQHIETEIDLPVNVMCGFEAGFKFELEDIDVFCNCGNPSGVQTTCMETGDAVCNDCGNFIKG